MNNYLWDSEREVLCYAKTGEPVGLNDLPDATTTTAQAEQRKKDAVTRLHRHMSRQIETRGWIAHAALSRLEVSPRFLPHPELSTAKD